MKKSMLILLAASSLLLVGCSKTEETKTSRSSTSSSASSSSSSSQSSSSSSSQSSSASSSSESSAISTTVTDRKMNLKEVEQGNFESIQGTWTNKDGDSFTISNNIFQTNGKNFTLSVFFTPNGYPVLNAAGFPVGFALAEAGSTFKSEPGTLSSALSSGETDQTDMTKDRIILAQNEVTGEGAKEITYYRQ